MKHFITLVLSLVLFLIGSYYENNYLYGAGFFIAWCGLELRVRQLREQEDATEEYKKTARRLRQINQELETGRL